MYNLKFQKILPLLKDKFPTMAKELIILLQFEHRSPFTVKMLPMLSSVKPSSALTWQAPEDYTRLYYSTEVSHF